MAALDRRRAAARQARRILQRQIEGAAHRLRHTGDADIHEARKGIKRSRATLALLRGALPRAAWRSANATLRAAARPLSEARDAKILVDAFDALARHYARVRGLAAARRLRTALVRQRARARREVTRGAGGVRRSRRLLRRAAAAGGRWSVASCGWRGLCQAATRLYARGRATLGEVRREPSVECLHRWRKQAKRLCYQLELLAPLSRPAIAHLARELHTLSDELGDDHDLALLRAAFSEHLRGLTDEASAATLVTAIERARTRLQRQALLRGARLYRPTPARFAQLLKE